MICVIFDYVVIDPVTFWSSFWTRLDVDIRHAIRPSVLARSPAGGLHKFSAFGTRNSSPLQSRRSQPRGPATKPGTRSTWPRKMPARCYTSRSFQDGA